MSTKLITKTCSLCDYSLSETQWMWDKLEIVKMDKETPPKFSPLIHSGCGGVLMPTVARIGG